MDFAQFMMLLLQFSIVMAVFGYGLNASTADVLFLKDRPGLLLRSLLAIFVVVPIIAVMLARGFSFKPVVEIALVSLAVSPLPPLMPGKFAKAEGRGSYGVSLLMICAAASIVIVPLLVEIIELFAGRQLTVERATIVGLIATGLVGPFAAGMTINYFWPGLARRIEAPTATIAKLLLVIAIVPAIVVTLPAVWSLIGDGTILAITIFVVAALLAGHLLGGPHPEDRRVLALASATRHPGIAISIAAANFHEESFTAAILLYFIVSAVLCTPYMLWSKNAFPLRRGVTHHGG